MVGNPPSVMPPLQIAMHANATAICSDKDRKMARKGTHNQTISGIVVPSQWDDTGKITGLTIQSFNENEYLVESRKIGKDLNSLLHKKVEVTGRVKEHLDGKKTIRIQAFRPMGTDNCGF